MFYSRYTIRALTYGAPSGARGERDLRSARDDVNMSGRKTLMLLSQVMVQVVIVINK